MLDNPNLSAMSPERDVALDKLDRLDKLDTGCWMLDNPNFSAMSPEKDVGFISFGCGIFSSLNPAF
jgi:hypothetical protein